MYITFGFEQRCSGLLKHDKPCNKIVPTAMNSAVLPGQLTVVQTCWKQLAMRFRAKTKISLSLHWSSSVHKIYINYCVGQKQRNSLMAKTCSLLVVWTKFLSTRKKSTCITLVMTSSKRKISFPVPRVSRTLARIKAAVWKNLEWTMFVNAWRNTMVVAVRTPVCIKVCMIQCFFAQS